MSDDNMWSVVMVMAGILFIAAIWREVGRQDRYEARLIEEWYSRGPYQATWTLDGIRVMNTVSGEYPRMTHTYCLGQEHQAKLRAANMNKEAAGRQALLDLYAEKNGEVIQ
jgi:hypothetical protein